MAETKRTYNVDPPVPFFWYVTRCNVWIWSQVRVRVRAQSWEFNSHHVRNVTRIVLDSKHCINSMFH